MSSVVSDSQANKLPNLARQSKIIVKEASQKKYKGDYFLQPLSRNCRFKVLRRRMQWCTCLINFAPWENKNSDNIFLQSRKFNCLFWKHNEFRIYYSRMCSQMFLNPIFCVHRLRTSQCPKLRIFPLRGFILFTYCNIQLQAVLSRLW